MRSRPTATPRRHRGTQLPVHGRDSAYPPLVDWRTVYRQWFAGLARDYHPDRTLDDGKGMKVINDAAERLRNLLEES
jgi:hypothetical protein